MFYTLIYKILKFFGVIKKNTYKPPVAVKGENIDRLVMENNVFEGVRMVEADKLTNSKLLGNKVVLRSPQETPLWFKALIDFSIALLAAYFSYSFGWI